MAVGFTVAAEDEIDCLLHLGDVACGAGVQGLLHHRLFSATLTPEGALQRLITAQARVDLAEAVRAGEDGDEGVVELLDGGMTNGLLLDEDVFLDRVKELERANLDADGSERGVRRVVLRRLLRARHSVPPENEEHYKSLVASTAYEPRSSLFCTKLRRTRPYQT